MSEGTSAPAAPAGAPPGPAWRPWAEGAAWAALYAALAVGCTWPLVPNMVDHLPKGNVPTSVPASAGTWALWWVADRLPHLFVGMWDGPIFFPAPDTFGYSETTLPLGIASAPLFWLGAEAPFVYNVVVLACLVLNGLSVRSLARTLGCTGSAAGLAGLLMAVTPLCLLWISVLPLVPLFGIAWFFEATLKFGRAPGPRTGALAGFWLAISWLLCLQYGLFLTLVAPLLGLVVRWRDRGTWTGIGAAAVVGLALLGPVLLPQRAILEAQGFERSEERAERGAFVLENSWLNAPVPPRLHLPGPSNGPGTPIYPGTIPLLLIAVAVGRRTLARGRGDLEVASLVVVTVVSVVLSVLPNLGAVGADLYAFLRDWVPGLALIREGKRAGAAAVVLLPVLVGLGLDPLTRARRWWPRAWVLVAVTVANDWPTPARLQPAPTVAEHRGLVAALRQHVPDDGAVALLPFEDDRSPTPEADRMVLQAGHGRVLVNGYSSYYPKTYWRLRKAFHGGPSSEGLKALIEAGVTHVAAPEGWLGDLPEAVEVWRGEGSVIYELRPGS